MTESDDVIAILTTAFEHPYYHDALWVGRKVRAIQMASGPEKPEWVFDHDGVIHIRMFRTRIDGRFDIWCDEITKNTVTHVILGGFEVIEFLVEKIPELAIRLARNGR